MNTFYKITIERTEQYLKPKTGSVLIEKRPYTDKEIEDSGHYAKVAADKGEPYTKEIHEKYDTSEVAEDKQQIYEQKVEELDLPAVIKAINKI